MDYTAANATGITQAHTLLHGEEDMVSVDSGYKGLGKRKETTSKRTLCYRTRTSP
ncbi:hypothetical protein [Xanthomonas pisi]|uniref:hypothetical protein n=1 Tax=Xanthomonas pisi TaxID=56457 RepID=UPI000B056DC2|nr:hypothetical protein [Xanthomonas pisi]